MSRSNIINEAETNTTLNLSKDEAKHPLSVALEHSKKGQKYYLSDDFDTALNEFEKAIILVKGVMEKKPHHKQGRDLLKDIWDHISRLYPNPDQINAAPEVVESSPSETTHFNLNKIKTMFLDTLIESDWKKQCNGKFGGPKPTDKSWKQFYEETEAEFEHQDRKEKVVWAAERGHYQLIQDLIDQSAKINPETSKDNHKAPLLVAVQHNYTKVVTLLLENAAKVNIKGHAKWTPLHWAAYRMNTNVCDKLIEKKAKVNVKDIKGFTPLHWSALKGDLQTARLLIENGAKVNVPNNNGITPLHWAIFSGHPSIVSILLEHGAKVNGQDKFKRTLLHWATANGRKDMVRLLLEKGAKPNVCDVLKRSPLHWAAQKGHYDIVSILLDYNVTTNREDKFGDRPLMLAAKSDHPKVVSLLFEKGAR